MSKPLFIYPQWQRTKIELMQRLQLDLEQQRILDAWLRKHIFEFGTEYTMDARISKDMNPHLEEDILNSSIQELTAEVIKSGMYMASRRTIEFPPADVITTSILICGFPSLGVGPEKRQG